MNEIILFFTFQVLEENLVFMFSKYLKEKMNATLNGGKTLKERILKNIFVCEIHNPEYQLIKSMYKIITSLFLQKSLKVLGRLFYNNYFCNKRDLEFDKTVAYVIEVMEKISNLFISFYEKISKAQKAPKRKTSDFYPLRSLFAQKTVAFVVFCLLISVLLVGFLFVSVFVRLKSFRKKKKK